MTKINTGSVWLSLYLAEWPATSTTVLSIETTSTTTVTASASASVSGITSVDLLQTSYREDAMVYPWTDSLSWKDAKDILLPQSSSSASASSSQPQSQPKSQLPSSDNDDCQSTTTSASVSS